MARGRYPIRIAATNLDPRTVERYRLRWPGDKLYGEPEAFPPVTARHLFGRDGKLSLDLGCGTAEFLCALAARSPQELHLGVDHSRKPLDRAVETADRLGLDNVRFVLADIKLFAPRLLPGTLSNVYLHFPVPLGVTRRRRHRTYSPEILAHLGRALVPGGRLSLMTDDESVVRDARAAMEVVGGFRELAPEQFALTMSADLKSPYQRQWEARGRVIRQFEYERAKDGDVV